MLKALRLMTYMGGLLILIEGLQHYLLQHEGSIVQRVSYTFIIFAVIAIVRFLIIHDNLFVKENAAFIINLTTIIAMTEQSFFLSPKEFQISPM